MIKRLKIELIYFSVILIILALVQHPDLLSTPLDRLQNMQEHKNYLHPLLWTSVIYVVVFIIRVIVKFIRGFFKKKD